MRAYRILLTLGVAASACAPPEHDFMRRADSAQRAFAADSAAQVNAAAHAASRQRALDSAVALDAASRGTDGPDGAHRFSAVDSLPTMILDATADTPRLERLGRRTLLHLPPRMMAALQAATPGFRTFRRADFAASLPDSVYGDASKEALFAVIGDFDGNSRLDVVLYGRDTSVVLVAIVDDKAGPHVFELDRDTDERVPGVEGSLSYRAPGDLKGDDDQPMRIEHDFFSLDHEMSSAIYYYLDGRFVNMVVGD
jgi:hypothetical protein